MQLAESIPRLEKAAIDKAMTRNAPGKEFKLKPTPEMIPPKMI